VTIKRKKEIVAEQYFNEHVHAYRYGNAIEYLAAYFELHLHNPGSLLKMYENKEFDAITVAIMDKQALTKTRRPLNVKIKYLSGDTTKKKGIMRCGKCLYVVNKKDLGDLEWFIKVHINLGYDKVYICSQMSDDEPAFDQLILKYKRYLQVDSLKCIPNLQPHAYLANVTYLKYNTDLTKGETIGEFDRIKYYSFEYLSVNECYNENIDKYRHITIYDTDELVLARRIKNFNTFDKVKNYVQNPTVEVTCDSYLNIEQFFVQDLQPRLNISNEISLHFKHGSYISNDIVDELFKILKLKQTFLIAEALKDDKFINFKIDVIQVDRLKKFHVGGPVSFTINGRKELKYALDLLKLYDGVIKPFLENSTNDLSRQVGSKFNRLFFLSGELNHGLVGKSVLNTQRIMDVFIHYGFGYVDRRNGELAEVMHGMGNIADPALNNRDFVVPKEMAHLGHFRDHLEINTQNLPFASLHFDLNYFKCYLIPILFGSEQEKKKS
jgi:hypothetical protein